MTRASMTLFWFSLTIIVSLGLYHTSYRTEQLGRTLRTLNAKIESEQKSIHVLKAEYVYLTDPSRIEAVARKHLDMKPTSPNQITKLSKLRSIIPTRKEAMGSTMVSSTPIANLRARTALRRPRVTNNENGHVNTRLVIRKTASAEPLRRDHSLAMINDDDETEYSYALPGEQP